VQIPGKNPVKVNDFHLPVFEIVGLELGKFNALSSKTRFIASGIGPYHLYSSPVVVCKYGHTLCRIVSVENLLRI